MQWPHLSCRLVPGGKHEEQLLYQGRVAWRCKHRAPALVMKPAPRSELQVEGPRLLRGQPSTMVSAVGKRWWQSGNETQEASDRGQASCPRQHRRAQDRTR